MNRSKGSFWNIGCCLGGILLSPIFLVILVLYICYTPIDFIIYMRSEYRRKTGQKYVWLVSTSRVFKLFTLIDKNNLDIRYYPIPNTSSGSGYLITGDSFIDFDSFVFLGEDGDWYINVENTDQKLGAVEEITLSTFEKEHGFRPRRVVYLIDEGDIGEAGHLEKARDEKRFFLYNKKDNGSLLEALKKIIGSAIFTEESTGDKEQQSATADREEPNEE